MLLNKRKHSAVQLAADQQR